MQEVDKHSRVDPAMIATNGHSTQFAESHPSVYMPKHQYRKYKMKGGRNGTGLGVIQEKPVANSQFAIMHLLGMTNNKQAAS